jgi:hypothetical protein
MDMCSICFENSKYLINTCNTCKVKCHQKCWYNYCHHKSKDESYMLKYYNNTYFTHTFYCEPININCHNCRSLTNIDIGGIKTRQMSLYKRQVIFIFNTKIMISNLKSNLKLYKYSDSIFREFFEYIYKNRELLNTESRYSELIKDPINLYDSEIKETINKVKILIKSFMYTLFKKISNINISESYYINRYYLLIFNDDISSYQIPEECNIF